MKLLPEMKSLMSLLKRLETVDKGHRNMFAIYLNDPNHYHIIILRVAKFEDWSIGYLIFSSFPHMVMWAEEYLKSYTRR